jgi:hypothetical protein
MMAMRSIGKRAFDGLAALGALSRVALAVHEPSDVLVGPIFGLLRGVVYRRQLHRFALALDAPLGSSPHAELAGAGAMTYCPGALSAGDGGKTGGALLAP